MKKETLLDFDGFALVEVIYFGDKEKPLDVHINCPHGCLGEGFLEHFDSIKNLFVDQDTTVFQQYLLLEQDFASDSLGIALAKMLTATGQNVALTCVKSNRGILDGNRVGECAVRKTFDVEKNPKEAANIHEMGEAIGNSLLKFQKKNLRNDAFYLDLHTMWPQCQTVSPGEYEKHTALDKYVDAMLNPENQCHDERKINLLVHDQKKHPVADVQRSQCIANAFEDNDIAAAIDDPYQMMPEYRSSWYVHQHDVRGVAIDIPRHMLGEAEGLGGARWKENPERISRFAEILCDAIIECLNANETLSAGDPITDIRDIEQFYEQKFQKNGGQKIGLEWERTAVYAKTQNPVPYLGEHGYAQILEQLCERYNWVKKDVDNGYPFTLQRGDVLVTTEADGKPEISGAAHDSLWNCKTEIEGISKEINTITKDWDIRWLTNGMPPFAHEKDIELAPKNRYLAWARLFPEHKTWMHRYMKTLCGAHINVDVDNTEDMMIKTKLLLRMSPILCGALANSPMYAGQKTKYKAARRKAIFSPESFGREYMPAAVMEPEFAFRDWIHFFLERDMFILNRGETMHEIAAMKKTFADFVSAGIIGEHALISDFDVHIKTCWVDVRPRIGYLEYRPLDGLPLPDFVAAAALIKGLIYHESGHRIIEQVTEAWSTDDYENLHNLAATDGIDAEYKGQSFASALASLIDIAEKNLKNMNNINADGQDESTLLEPLKYIIESGNTPGDQFVQNLKKNFPSFEMKDGLNKEI